MPSRSVHKQQCSWHFIELIMISTSTGSMPNTFYIIILYVPFKPINSHHAQCRTPLFNSNLHLFSTRNENIWVYVKNDKFFFYILIDIIYSLSYFLQLLHLINSCFLCHKFVTSIIFFFIVSLGWSTGLDQMMALRTLTTPIHGD